MRRRRSPRFFPVSNNIVEMKLEVNLSSYDELLAAESVDPTRQEVA